MASKYSRVELSYTGIGEMLKSDMMAGIVMSHANAIALRAGQNYEVARTSQRVMVHPSNAEGEQDNLDNNTLLKSMR